MRPYILVETAMLLMHPATAYAKLMRKIATEFFVLRDGNACKRCGSAIDLENEKFHFDHVMPWRGSDRPIELYFDLDNIRLSHARCNADEAYRRRLLKKR